MSDLFMLREAEASCRLDGETHVIATPYDHLVEPTAIVLHSFDGYALEAGQAWDDASEDKKDAYRYQADVVLHAIVPAVERAIADDNGRRV
jgi:hypothetical protein